MNKHFNDAVDPYDGGLTICRGCKAQGTFTELPDGDCPTPYKPDSVLLAESMAREQALQLRLNAADQRIDELTIPDGYCIMPVRLTAENGAKGLLLGEFQLSVTQDCPECAELEEPSEFCNICDGEGEYGQQHTIPWDQIKFIYSKAVGGLSIKAPARQPRLTDEVQIKGMIEAIGGKFAIMIDEANAHYGWTFQRHPDGMWVSGRKATDAEMHAARTHAHITSQQ